MLSKRTPLPEISKTGRGVLLPSTAGRETVACINDASAKDSKRGSNSQWHQILDVG